MLRLAILALLVVAEILLSPLGLVLFVCVLAIMAGAAAQLNRMKSK